MPTSFRLLCVLAHPDDETFATGGLLARYAAEGVGTYLLTATRGERGWQGSLEANPGPAALGATREQELHAAARTLGLRGLRLLHYPDGDLAFADHDEVAGQIAQYIRQVQPHVVVTFGPYGLTGHPDHIAICQRTTAAILRAADCADVRLEAWDPHRVTRLYYLVDSRERLNAFEAVFGDTAMTVEGVRRTVPGWPDWAITTRIETAALAEQVWAAVACHRSQVPNLDELNNLPEARRRELWRVVELYCVCSLTPIGPEGKDDLFAGLRRPAEVAQ
jgi:LmbE family N-acetylglucosaminyl deacetylase